MPHETVEGLLRATLDPILAVRDKWARALILATRHKLSGPTIYVIKGCIRDLDVLWENANDIAETLDPTDPKKRP